MKKILFVEDDALIARMYSQKLAQGGFEVAVAEDGLAAMKCLPAFAPDLVVLDLMMPKLSGVDVLRFIRGHPQMKSLPVIVLSNEFLNEFGEQALKLGAQEVLAKAAANPRLLIETINKILNDGAVPPLASPESPAAPPEKQPDPLPPLPPSTRPAFVPTADPAENSPSFHKRIRRDFFEQLAVISQSLRQARDDFMADSKVSPIARLESLGRKMGFVSHMTSLAGCYRIAQLSSALEALLFELQERPDCFNPSCRHTIDSTVLFVADCITRAENADEQCFSPTTVLIVDDDKVSNRALVLALNRTKLVPHTLTDPREALKALAENSYDVVVLDINLPGMDGMKVCEEMRRMPLHKETPVIFFTSHTEFEERARSLLGARDDFISKPILPIELTVKITMNVLRSREARQTPPSA